MRLLLGLLLSAFTLIARAGDAVEDAAPLLDPLRGTTSLSINEVAPPKGVAGHEMAIHNPKVSKVGEYYILPGDPLFGQTKKKIGELILAKDVFVPSSGEKKSGDFHPDYAIRWNYIDERDPLDAFEPRTYEEEVMRTREVPPATVPVDLLICSARGEAILRQGDKVLLYDLGKAALKDFKNTLPNAEKESWKEAQIAWSDYKLRRKPPVELTESFRETLRQGAPMKVHEGLPHPYHLPKLLAAEMQREDVAKIGGHAFYTPPRDVSENAGLRKILTDAKAVTQRSDGMKMCGGFHPDYAVSWESGGQTVYCLVCFGCAEITYLSGDRGLRYDMGEVYKPLKESLTAYRVKCPQPEPQE